MYHTGRCIFFWCSLWCTHVLRWILWGIWFVMGCGFLGQHIEPDVAWDVFSCASLLGGHQAPGRPGRGHLLMWLSNFGSSAFPSLLYWSLKRLLLILNLLVSYRQKSSSSGSNVCCSPGGVPEQEPSAQPGWQHGGHAHAANTQGQNAQIERIYGGQRAKEVGPPPRSNNNRKNKNKKKNKNTKTKKKEEEPQQQLKTHSWDQIFKEFLFYENCNWKPDSLWIPMLTDLCVEWACQQWSTRPKIDGREVSSGTWLSRGALCDFMVSALCWFL